MQRDRRNSSPGRTKTRQPRATDEIISGESEDCRGRKHFGGRLKRHGRSCNCRSTLRLAFESYVEQHRLSRPVLAAQQGSSIATEPSRACCTSRGAVDGITAQINVPDDQYRLTAPPELSLDHFQTFPDWTETSSARRRKRVRQPRGSAALARAIKKGCSPVPNPFLRCSSFSARLTSAATAELGAALLALPACSNSSPSFQDRFADLAHTQDAILHSLRSKKVTFQSVS
jgi:hypothetical protein